MARSGMMTPAQIVDKQIANGSAATEAYRKGVQRVTQAPGIAAAAAKQKYLNGVQQNADKWAKNVGAVPLQTWVGQCIDVGAGRIGTGLEASRPKSLAFWNEFGPFLENARQQVLAMPGDTFEQRKQRANKQMDLTHSFRRRA